MEKESWYVIQTLADHESQIKLMCEERIHKDVKKNASCRYMKKKTIQWKMAY